MYKNLQQRSKLLMVFGLLASITMIAGVTGILMTNLVGKSAVQVGANLAPIGGAMTNINQATTQSQAGTQQVEGAAGDLSKLSFGLAELVGQFEAQS